MEDNRIKRVVVLGGGTAGWMAASYLGKALQGTAKITVLESPAIPKIGVGEATVPNLQRVFFNYLGLKEDDWMKECNAAFKTAIRYVNWNTPGEGVTDARKLPSGHTDHFYHPFGILPFVDQIPLSHYWNNKRLHGETNEPYDYACFKTIPAMDAKKSPRFLDGKPCTYYAWHFDAHLVADFLMRFSTKTQGVERILDEMESVNFDNRGYVTGLKTKTGRVIEGDLFVDCSGFRGLLINQAMKEPFIDMSNYLFNDSAVASCIPNDDDKNGIDPYTSAIAMKSGWTWKIPMLGRHGSGYVYSSKFSSQDEAIRDFCKLWNIDPEKAPLNKIRFRVGRNRRAWVKNVVSVGLASCFLEPLESSGIYFITAAIYQLTKHFPNKNFDQILVDRFNREIEDMFDDTRDFIQAHFFFARRNDTPFWKAMKELKLAPQIEEKIEMYRKGLAVNAPISDNAESYYDNFDIEFKNFWTNGSYYCIFAGLGFMPDQPLPLMGHQPNTVKKAEAAFAKVKREQKELLDTLPTCHEFLKQLHGK